LWERGPPNSLLLLALLFLLLFLFLLLLLPLLPLHLLRFLLLLLRKICEDSGSLLDCMLLHFPDQDNLPGTRFWMLVRIREALRVSMIVHGRS